MSCGTVLSKIQKKAFVTYICCDEALKLQKLVQDSVTKKLPSAQSLNKVVTVKRFTSNKEFLGAFHIL